MARTVTDVRLESRTARARLEPRKKPYYRLIDPGRHLGYYRGVRGGVWIARMKVDGAYREAKLATADDVSDANGEDFLSFAQAQAAARLWFDRQIQERKAPPATTQTVRQVVEDYVAERNARERTRKGRANALSSADYKMRVHVLGRPELADLQCRELTIPLLRQWRRSLPGSVLSRRRVGNDLKAALNRLEADPVFRHIVKEGLASPISEHGLQAGGEGSETHSRTLGDEEIRSLLREIKAQGDEDVYHLCFVLAATGARFAQACRLTVGDVQLERGRLLMPPSFKGRPSAKRASIPIPLGPDAIEVLRPIVEGRGRRDILLERWRRKQVKGATWEKDRRGPWTSVAELSRSIRKAANSAGLPEGISSYTFRHSSIMQALREGLPTDLVAKLHDTSIEMIKRNYTAHLADALEEVARRAIVKLV